MPETVLGLYDWLIIGLYFTVLALLSFSPQWKDKAEEDFLLSGRSVTLLPFIATLVSTWYGGILGVGEYTVQYGISQWVIFGLPYYIFALLFAWLLAGEIRTNRALTIPEAVKNAYGVKEANWSALLIFILVSPAPYILMMGLILQFMAGGAGNMFVFAGAITFFSALYINFSGYSVVIRTDIFQALIMFLAFILLFVFSWWQNGSLSVIWLELPASYRNITGGQDWSYILVWFFIALWTFVDPGFHQRAASAKSPTIARRGIVCSVGLWFIFDFLTLSCGLYAFHALQHPLQEPVLAYPKLARLVLPPGLLGLFLVGVMATIMSTLDSFLFISGQTLGRDLFKPLFPEIKSTTLSRTAIFISAAGGIVLIYFIPSVVELWYTISSITIPGLLFPILGIYLAPFKVRKNWVLPLMIISNTTSLIWFLAGFWLGAQPYAGIEPFYPGFIISLLFWLVSKLSNRLGVCRA